MTLAMMVAPTFATNGYFAHGYGLKTKGMGGAATARALDSFGGADNPASMVWAGSRLDLGLDWFRPVRVADRSDAGFTTVNGGVKRNSHNSRVRPTCCAAPGGWGSTCCNWSSRQRCRTNPPHTTPAARPCC